MVILHIQSYQKDARELARHMAEELRQKGYMVQEQPRGNAWECVLHVDGINNKEAKLFAMRYEYERGNRVADIDVYIPVVSYRKMSWRDLPYNANRRQDIIRKGER